MNNYLAVANQVAQLLDPIHHKYVEGKKVLVFVHEGKYYNHLLYVDKYTNHKIIQFLNQGHNNCYYKHIDAN